MITLFRHDPRNGKDPAKAGPLNRNPMIGGDHLGGLFRPDDGGHVRRDLLVNYARVRAIIQVERGDSCYRF